MEIICLANSFKHQGRCIAGVDPKSGRWVRPISDLDDGRIPIGNKSIPVDSIKTLDILDILIDTSKKSGYEIENFGYETLPWQVVGKAETVNLLKYCEQELLFPNHGKAIPYEYLRTQAPVRTLQLLEVKSFTCRRERNGKWRGVIADERFGLADVDLSITDPVALEKLNQYRTISPHCLLCLSLSQPFQKEPSDLPLCYRLIAGVIELLPELELITKEMERLSWTAEQGKQYLRDKFGKSSRYQLTETEAKQFLFFLTDCADHVEAEGEVLPQPLNSGRIGANYLRAIDKEDDQQSGKNEDLDKGWSLAKIRKSSPNAYKSWTSEEDMQLVELYKQGKSIGELALELGRQRGGIEARLKKLGEM